MLFTEKKTIYGFRYDANLIFLISLLVLVCLYDLLSPPLATTIWRQTQTAMITNNFVKEGFSLQGLYVGLKGNEKFMMAYEFPVYNFIVGIFVKLFNDNPIWGKLVSLLSAIASLIIFQRLIKSISDDSIAFVSSLFLILIPVDVLMFTAFQPDSFGIMLVILSVYILNKWRSNFRIGSFAICCVLLLLSGLCKFPILVPYIPVFLLIYFFPSGKFRYPKLAELLTVFVLFIVPFFSWYIYRTQLTDQAILDLEHTDVFFLGNLSRFLSIDFYIRPAMALFITVWCGIGVLYFVYGLKKMSVIELMIFSGIPLYYILIPTSADQSYYIFALGPIMAFFMGKGATNIAHYFYGRRMNFINYLLGGCFLVLSFFGINYVLRPDKVMMPLSEAMGKISQAEDLIFVVNMHDRGVWVGGFNPEVVYFTKRNGWNVQDFNPHDFKSTIDEIAEKQREGAKWLTITWYTPVLEPWYSSLLPQQFSREPDFDSKAIADKLRKLYKTEIAGENFAILNLTK